MRTLLLPTLFARDEYSAASASRARGRRSARTPSASGPASNTADRRFHVRHAGRTRTNRRRRTKRTRGFLPREDAAKKKKKASRRNLPFPETQSPRFRRNPRFQTPEGRPVSPPLERRRPWRPPPRPRPFVSFRGLRVSRSPPPTRRRTPSASPPSPRAQPLASPSRGARALASHPSEAPVRSSPRSPPTNPSSSRRARRSPPLFRSRTTRTLPSSRLRVPLPFLFARGDPRRFSSRARGDARTPPPARPRASPPRASARQGRVSRPRARRDVR